MDSMDLVTIPYGRWLAVMKMEKEYEEDQRAYPGTPTVLLPDDYIRMDEYVFSSYEKEKVRLSEILNISEKEAGGGVEDPYYCRFGKIYNSDFMFTVRTIQTSRDEKIEIFGDGVFDYNKSIVAKFAYELRWEERDNWQKIYPSETTRALIETREIIAALKR